MVFACCYPHREHSEDLQLIFRKYSDTVEILVLRGLAGMMYSQTCPQGKEREGANRRLECNNSRDQNYTHAGDCIPPTQI